MTEFVGWRLCLIVFKTLSDRSCIRTHAHTRVPEFSTEEFPESGASDRWTSLPGFCRRFPFWFMRFKLGKMSIEKCNVLNGFCLSIWKDLHLNPRVHPCFTCLGRVSSFLCTLKPLFLSTTDDVAIFLFFFALYCHLQLTFKYGRICQLEALPHRVQNVFWHQWDSNPRTHSCNRLLDWGISWVWRLRPLSHLAWVTSTVFCMICDFSMGSNLHFRDLIC